MGQTVKMGNGTLKLNNGTQILNTNNIKVTTFINLVGNVLELNNGNYYIKEVIDDRSGEADIYLGEFNNKQYAIKIYRSNFKYDKEKLSKIKSLKSIYINSIVDEAFIDDRYVEVTRYYKNGDISTLKLNEQFIEKVVVKNINEALRVMHKSNLFHRDIKPNNIFLSDDKKSVVLGDFGTMSLSEEGVSVKHTSIGMTTGYASPESYNGLANSESDYYSLGITILHLLMGEYPFKDLTFEQILKRTFADKIEIPKFINSRFVELIQGLTQKDRNYRWGYEEVKRWLNGEKVPVYFKSFSESNIKLFPEEYIFNKKTYNDYESLSKALAENWDEGKKHFLRGYLNNFFKTFNQDLASKIQDVLDDLTANRVKYRLYANVDKEDVEYFKVLYLLNNNLPLTFKSVEFNDIKSLINVLYKDIKSEKGIYYVSNLLFTGNLEFYLKIKGVKDDNKLLKTLSDLRELSKSSINKAYYGFILLGEEIGFKFKEKEFFSLKELLKYLSSLNGNAIDKISQELLKSDYFYMWMKKLGYENMVDRFFEF